MSGIKKIAAFMAAFVGSFVKSVPVFFGIKREDGAEGIIKKIFVTIFKGSSYATADYVFAGLTASIVSFLKYNDMKDGSIFIILWLANMVISFAFIKIDGTIEDFTLTNAMRDTASSIYKESRVAGVITFILLMAKIVFWDGPERMVLYFKKELAGKKITEMVVLVIFSGIQMAIWTKIYSLGYESVVDLIRSL